jgi:hypothetical protein
MVRRRVAMRGRIDVDIAHARVPYDLRRKRGE